MKIMCLYLMKIKRLDQISVGSCNGEFKLNEIIVNTIENLKEFLKFK